MKADIEKVLWMFAVMVTTVTASTRRQGSASDSDGARTRTVQYENFDEYLIDVVAPRQFSSVQDGEESSAPSSTLSPEESAPLDILDYFRDVPRMHWSCCMLGKLAGDKGFHCHVGFYATRITSRNLNRAHNRRMSFQTASHLPRWARSIMHLFGRCITRSKDEFHKCCYAASVERREMAMWQQYRHEVATTGLRLELQS